MIAQFCNVSQIRFYLTFSKSGPMCYCSNNQKKGIKSPLTIAWHTMEKQSTSSASQYTWHSISWHSELIFQCLQPGFLFTLAQHEKDLLDELEWVLHRVGLVETQCTCKSKQKAHSFWQVFNVVHHDFSFNDDLQWGWTEMEGRWRHSTFTLNKQDPDVPGDRGACLSELLQHFQTEQYLGMLCSCTCSLPIFQGSHLLDLVILSGEKQQICLPQSILYINRNIWDIIFLATVSVRDECERISVSAVLAVSLKTSSHVEISSKSSTGMTFTVGFSRTGVTILYETESYFMGTESYEGLPVWYTLLK